MCISFLARHPRVCITHISFSPKSRNMPPDTLAHRRTHNLLLISRLLGLRDNVSPFTLLLDSLSQSAKPLISEHVRRASVCYDCVISPGCGILTGIDSKILGCFCILRDVTSSQRCREVRQRAGKVDPGTAEGNCCGGASWGGSK